MTEIISIESGRADLVVEQAGGLGPPGLKGDSGEGVPVGGTTGQALIKSSATDFDTEWGEVVSGGGVSDHGALTGLGDDDHTQYHTDARGDARYMPLGAAPTAHKTSHATGGADALVASDIGAAATTHAHAPAQVTGTAVITSDARLSDARTPTAHKSSHATGGADALTAADIGAVPAATFDANSILAATTDNTPAAVTVAEQRLVGRITGGNIDDLTGAQVAGMIDAADLTSGAATDGHVLTADGAGGSAWEAVSGGSGIPETIIDAKGDLIAGTAADTPARLAVGANGTVLMANSGATPGVAWTGVGPNVINPTGSGNTMRIIPGWSTWTNATTGSLSGATMYCTQVCTLAPLTISGVGLNLNGAAAAGKKIRLAVVNDRSSGGLGTVVAQGELAADSTGEKILTFGSNVTLLPGVVYWLVAYPEASCTAHAFPTGSNTVIGMLTDNNIYYRSWIQSVAYGPIADNVGALVHSTMGAIVWVVKA